MTRRQKNLVSSLLNRELYTLQVKTKNSFDFEESYNVLKDTINMHSPLLLHYYKKV